MEVGTLLLWWIFGVAGTRVALRRRYASMEEAFLCEPIGFVATFVVYPVVLGPFVFMLDSGDVMHRGP